MKFLSYRLALYGSTAIFIVFSFFHLLVIIGTAFFDLSLYEVLWGGRLKSNEELLNFEFVSISIQLFCVAVMFAKMRMTDASKATVAINICIWILFVLFALNTIGNVLANSLIEKIVFTPITLILAIFMFRIGIEKASPAPLNPIDKS